MERYSLTAPNRKENVSMIRLMTSFVAAKMKFDIEAIEDLKVCVGEALNYHIEKTENFHVIIIEDEEFIEIQFDLGDFDHEEGNPLFDENLSKLILDSLMDHVEFNQTNIVIRKKKEQ